MKKGKFLEFLLSTATAIIGAFIIFYLAPGSAENFSIFNISYWYEATKLLIPKFLVTSTLTLGAIAISLFIALPLGISLADREYGYISYSPQKHWPGKLFYNRILQFLNYISPSGYVIFSILSSFPIFYVSYFSWAYFFKLQNRIVSIKDPDSFFYLIIPIIVLSFGNGLLSEFIRIIREETNNILKQNYIIATLARGVPITKHLFKNTIIPLANLLSSRLIILLGGAVIVEIIFSISGVGLWAYDIVIYQRGQTVSFYYIILITISLSIMVNLTYFANQWLQIKVDPRNRIKSNFETQNHEKQQ